MQNDIEKNRPINNLNAITKSITLISAGGMAKQEQNVLVLCVLELDFPFQEFQEIYDNVGIAR